ncbi:hypothetical protein LSAT2_020513 [Lamellibrachia satsuma]|nr:hypothetical protein LSAT2_020513 [Lamellibrachia satsuma]
MEGVQEVLEEWKEVFKKCWRSGRRCSRSVEGMEGGVPEVLEEWKEVFKKCWRNGRRCSRSAGGVEGGVQEVLEEWKELFKKCWRSGRRRCSRSAGGVEGGVQEVLKEWKVFKKCWRSGRRCSRSAGGVEGGVQEVLKEWKEVFKKCWRSGRRCSRSAGGMEGGVQEVLEEWKEVFKKCLRSGRSCSRSAGGVEGGVQEAHDEWKEVRDVRNAVMHSAKFEVTSADLTTYLATMTDLLKDQELQKYPTAQRAIVEITKIETLSLDINAAAVNELERSIWKAVVEDQTSNKQDILKVIESNEDLKSRLGDVYAKLTADIALLRGEVGALDERVANLEAAKDSTKEDNIRGEVGAHGVRIANLEAAKDPTETANIRAYVPKNESLKVLTSLFEMQDPDRVDTITSEIKSKQVLPTEMRALSWVLRQAKCPVTNLDLSWCRLDKDLVKQLNDGLAENKSIKSLALMYCHIDDVTAVDIVTGAITSPKLENLNLGGNHITPGAVRQLKEIRGGPRLLYLGEQESPPAEQHWGCDSRCVPWNQLHQVETATGRR